MADLSIPASFLSEIALPGRPIVFLPAFTHSLIVLFRHVDMNQIDPASGATPVLLFAQLKKRPPKPNYTCTAGTTNVCSDTSNGDAPLGTLKRVSCKQWNYCCGGNNQFVSGWCREETCNRYGAQTRDPVVSQCTNQQACQIPDRALCLGLQ